MNDQPTRITTTFSTLIDRVLSRKPDMIKEMKSLELGISDHMLVYVSLNTGQKRLPRKVINGPTYSKINLEQF